MMKRFSYLLICLGSLVLIWGVRSAPARGDAVVSGVVVSLSGERISGAVVRQQATDIATYSSADGSFTLDGLSEGITVTVTAWDEGYHPGGIQVVPPQDGVTITLKAHPTGDNPDYEWLTSLADPDDPIGCGHCMVACAQWETNAHSQSGINPRFFSLYNGTDISGTTTILPGYKLDFPGTAGNCASCHAPGAAANEPFTTDMNELSGVEAQGVFCDFCHKIGYAYLNPVTGFPYPNTPGVLSYRLYRPPPDTHMFFGPFDDVVRRVSYLELEKKSQFCAPCHQFSFWGTPIYESFGEWLQSPYPELGIECQTCHMKPTGVDYFVFPEKGGLIRDPDLIASHLQPGAADEVLLQNTVTMTVDVQQTGSWIWVSVTITNTDAGHHVPTDHPGRHMILTVQARDGQGGTLSQVGGPTVPDWGGTEAGLPGMVYAKLLRDAQTDETPVVSYWKQTFIASDNRIPALGSDTSIYRFAAPEGREAVTISVELRFRRVFQGLMDAKGWNTPDIIMEETEAVLVVETWDKVFLPLVRQ